MVCEIDVRESGKMTNVLKHNKLHTEDLPDRYAIY